MVGKNLKLLREVNGFSEKQMAQFLGVEESTYNNYESCTEDMPLETMEKTADLFGCDLIIFYEEDDAKVRNALAYTFHVENLSANDMKELSYFNKIVNKYTKISKIFDDSQ